MKWGYIFAQKLESDRSKGLPVSISLQTKPSRVSLESLGLGNIAYVPGNRPKVGQNLKVGVTSEGPRHRHLESVDS